MPRDPRTGHAFEARPLNGDELMTVRHRLHLVLTLALLCALGGCKGNYTFTDSDYRPLGDPHAINRGK